MLKGLFRSSKAAAEAAAGSALVPHRTAVEFALVQIDAPSDLQLQHTIAAVTGTALGHGGTVLQIVGPLVFVAFSGVIGCAPKSERQAFVSRVCSSHKKFVRVVHGAANALVGSFGCEPRMAYTAILDDFGAIIGQLTLLKPGQASEHSVQPGAAPNGGPAAPADDSRA